MAATKKCQICKKDILEGEETVPFKKKYAHTVCFNVYMKAVSETKKDELDQKLQEKKTTKRKAKPKAELKDPMSEEEYQDKKEFYEYVRQLIGNEDIPVKIYAIVSKYIDQYGFDFASMKQTLMYLHDIKQKELVGDIVGIIPFYYDEAKAFYKEVDRIDRQNQNVDSNGMYKQKTIYIKPKKREIKQLSFDD